MLNYRTPILIAIILAIAMVVGLIGYAIYNANNKPTEPPTDTDVSVTEPGETDNTDESTTTPETDEIPEPVERPNPPVIILDDNGGEDGKETADVVIDVLKENEEHQKPVNPSVDGDVVIEDGTKENAE